ncbi:unnamed protein product [Hapterophycus canaliculatus]
MGADGHTGSLVCPARASCRSLERLFRAVACRHVVSECCQCRAVIGRSTALGCWYVSWMLDVWMLSSAREYGILRVLWVLRLLGSRECPCGLGLDSEILETARRTPSTSVARVARRRSGFIC